jgi:hypothetical protein
VLARGGGPVGSVAHGARHRHLQAPTPSTRDTLAAREEAQSELARIAGSPSQVGRQRAEGPAARRALQPAATDAERPPLGSGATTRLPTAERLPGITSPASQGIERGAGALEHEQEDQASADKARKNRNRAAILIALLMSQ